MKAGDRIEWNGANRREHGFVVEKGGEFVIRMETGKEFALADIRYSRTAKLIER